MPRRIYLLIVFVLATTVLAQGCGPAATEVSTAAPVATERPEPTATAEATEATEVPATEEPTAEPTEPEPSPTEPEPSPMVTPEPEAPTATAEPEEPAATPEPTAEPAEPEGQVLLEARCTACHGLDRVESAQKSREEWVATVDRMVDYGAQLSESEQGVLLDYLVDTYGP